MGWHARMGGRGFDRSAGLYANSCREVWVLAVGTVNLQHLGTVLGGSLWSVLKRVLLLWWQQC